MPDVVRARVLDDDRTSEAGETTTTRPSSDEPVLSFARFFEHYNAQPDRKWEVEVLHQLLTFARLPAGWDSYGAPPMRWDAGLFALWILKSVMRPRTPMPHVVPSSVGGVQLEWHEKDIDLELHITAPYEWELWFRDRRSSAAPISESLSNDLSALAQPISQLTLR